MANTLYPKGKEKILTAGINMLTDTIKWALLKAAYAVNLSTHEFLSDLVTPVCALTTPGAASGTGSGTGGTLAAATYYVKISAIDSIGRETAVGAESTGVTTTGSTSSIAYTWTAVTSAVSYRIYYGTSTGGEAHYYTSATNSYTLAATAGTSATPPSSPTSVSAILSTNQAATNRSVTAGVFDCDPATWPAVTAGDSAAYAVLFKDTGVAGTSPLIFYADTITNFPTTTNGSDVMVGDNGGANKVFAL